MRKIIAIISLFLFNYLENSIKKAKMTRFNQPFKNFFILSRSWEIAVETIINAFSGRMKHYGRS
jgi:hypothetical protein